jgi:hypothetical protein
LAIINNTSGVPDYFFQGCSNSSGESSATMNPMLLAEVLNRAADVHQLRNASIGVPQIPC